MSDLTDEQEAERDRALAEIAKEVAEVAGLDEATAFKAVRLAYMQGYVAALRVREVT